MKHFLRKYQAIMLGAVGLLGFIGLWQWTAVGPMNDTVLPSATETFQSLFTLSKTAEFWQAVRATIVTAMQGFLIALVIAIPVGLLVGINQKAAAILRIPLEILRPIPPIVVLPLAVSVFGSSAAMARTLTVLGILPSLIIATAGGVRELDPVREDTGRSFRLTAIERARRIVLPSAMPSVITGMRISAFASILTVVMSQIVGGAPGLGKLIQESRGNGEIPTMYAVVIAIAILGFLVDTLVTAIQRQVLRWHDSVRGTKQVYPRKARFVSITQPVAEFMARVTAPIGTLLGKLVRDGRQRKETSPTTLKVLTWGTPAALLVIWWFATANNGPESPWAPLRKILIQFRKDWIFDGVRPHVVSSLTNMLIGFAIATVVGCIVGGAIGIFRPVRDLLEPLLALFRSIPGVAFIPILVTLMGFGSSMRITTIALASSFPIMISAADGVRAMDPMMKEVAASYGLSRSEQIRFMYLPAAMPRFMTGLQIGLSTALVVMVASELQGDSVGIGYLTNLYKDIFKKDGMWAGILLLAIIGLVSNYLLGLVSRRVLRWHEGQRAVARSN